VIVSHLPVFLRRFIRIGLLLPHLIWGLMLAGWVFPLIKPDRRDRFIMTWSRRLLGILGVRVQVAVPPRLSGGALLVCNHVSWLDIYLINAAQRVHFVSKAEVRGWPVAGWLAHKTGTLFIERGRRADTARVNADMRALLKMAPRSWCSQKARPATAVGYNVFCRPCCSLPLNSTAPPCRPPCATAHSNTNTPPYPPTSTRSACGKACCISSVNPA